jgi:hypothetical protein
MTAIEQRALRNTGLPPSHLSEITYRSRGTFLDAFAARDAFIIVDYREEILHLDSIDRAYFCAFAAADAGAAAVFARGAAFVV